MLSVNCPLSGVVAMTTLFRNTFTEPPSAGLHRSFTLWLVPWVCTRAWSSIGAGVAVGVGVGVAVGVALGLVVGVGGGVALTVVGSLSKKVCWWDWQLIGPRLSAHAERWLVVNA